jgi:hypothetical protein
MKTMNHSKLTPIVIVSVRFVRKPTTGTAQFYLHDRIGSVRLITDPAVNVTETLGYDAFGAQQ